MFFSIATCEASSSSSSKSVEKSKLVQLFTDQALHSRNLEKAVLPVPVAPGSFNRLVYALINMGWSNSENLGEVTNCHEKVLKKGKSYILYGGSVAYTRHWMLLGQIAVKASLATYRSNKQPKLTNEGCLLDKTKACPRPFCSTSSKWCIQIFPLNWPKFFPMEKSCQMRGESCTSVWWWGLKLLLSSLAISAFSTELKRILNSTQIILGF